MKSYIPAFLFFLLCAIGATCRAQNDAFIENKGQWESPFHYKLTLGNGSVFLEGNRVTFNLVERIKAKRKDVQASDFHHYEPDSLIRSHAYRMTFLGGNPSPEHTPGKKRRAYLNYLKGNDPQRWKGKVGLYEQVRYSEVYPRIDAVYYFSEDKNLKYDLVIKPGANPSQVKISYAGQEGLELVYGNLMVYTSIENVLESAPYAYQLENGERVEVPCEYRLEGNILSFDVGAYNREKELIIDPTLIFCTYSGSRHDNFGYTATYGADGSAYGGGVIFGLGSMYPTKMAFQSVSANSTGTEMDIAISKYTADGTDLIYSTYLGGTNNEMPYSLLEAKNGDLLILGNTGSEDFPMSSQAFSDSLSKGAQVGAIRKYYNGIDIFMARLGAQGDTLIGSTFIGDTAKDGLNTGFDLNYGDRFRGDIGEDSRGNIYAVSNSWSSDFPVKGPFAQSYQGKQDGVVFSFNADFSSLNWSTYVGGSENDALLSLKLVNDSLLYVTGASASTGLVPLGFPSYQNALSGSGDGFIAGFRASDGLMQYATYNGTPDMDANYFLEQNDKGQIYVFGQTRGIYPVGGVTDIFSEQAGPQFIQLFKPDLGDDIRSTVFGRSTIEGRANISPTALMVDICENVYVTGWGGGAEGYLNRQFSYNQGNTSQLYITNSAHQKTTDGSDFYFLVLDESWKKVNYATYFGQNGGFGDHVDGGTSRFRKDGTIFQAVCASCGSSSGFPVTDSAYSKVNRYGNQGGCNMAVFKFSIKYDEIIADLDIQNDSACIPYYASFMDNSYNRDLLIAERPNGLIDTLKGSSILIKDPGYQDIKFIAIDTTCGFKDSLIHTFYGAEENPSLSFAYSYDSCDADGVVELTNYSPVNSSISWDFGDGTTSKEQHPVHVYEEPGWYAIKLYGTGNFCGKTDSATQFIEIRDIDSKNDFFSIYNPCEQPLEATFAGRGSGFQVKKWYVNDKLVQKDSSNRMTINFGKPGIYAIRLDSEDTLCNRSYSYTQDFGVTGAEAVSPFSVPNIFTPNGDGVHDYFKASLKFPFQSSEFQLQVFNRWGVQVFEATAIEAGWNGSFENKAVPQGVYYFLLTYQDDCAVVHRLKGFVHLSR